MFSAPVEAPDFKTQRKRAKRKVRRAKRKLPPKRTAKRGLPPKETPTAFTRFRGGREPIRKILERSGTSEREFKAALAAALDPDTKILGVNVESTLEGRGITKDIGEIGVKILGSERGRDALRAAGIPIPQGEFGENVIRDAADIATNAIPSTYMTAAGIFEAAKGDPERIVGMWEDYKETSAIPAAIEGNFSEALERAYEHPVSTGLEVWGGKAVLGRGAGAAARRGLGGRRARRAASTARKPLHLYPKDLEGGPTVERTYSRDVINKGLQVAGEKLKRKAGRDPEVAEGRSSVHLADELPIRKDLLRRVDTRVFSGERIRRSRRTVAAKATEGLTKDEAVAVHLIVEGTVRRPSTLIRDLQKRLEHLDEVLPDARKMSKDVARANRAEYGEIQKLLERVRDDKVDVAEVFDRARQYVDQESDRQNRLQELGQYVDTEHAARWKPYLQAHHGLSGEDLDVAARALERRARRGKETPADPALVTQRPMGKRTAYYVPTMRGNGPPSPSRRRRSGTSYDLGARELGREPLVRQSVLAEGQATAVENFNALAQEFAVPARKDGGFANSWDEANRFGQELVYDEDGNLRQGHVPLVPVNVAAMRTIAAKLRQAQEHSRPGARLEQETVNSLAEAIQTAFERPTDGRGRFVLMPADVAKRIRDHQFTRTSVGRTLESLSNTFKDVVLTTSSPTTWLLGNVSDLTVRSVLAGITPLDVVRGAKVVRRARRVGGRRGEEVDQTLTGGGLYHSGEAATVHRPTRIGQNQVARAITAPYRVWRDNVYRLEHAIETLPQAGAVGKAMRRDTEMQKSLKGLLRLTDDQILNYAAKLTTDRALEARIQKQVEDVVGRWGKVSPTMRKALGGAPFVQWLAAALRYTYVTLPVHHPIKTALIAFMHELTDEERRKLGLTLRGDAEDRVVGYMQGAIPTNVTEGEYGPEVSGIRTANLASFGTAGAFPLNLPGFLAPQIKGPVLSLMGVAWTGDELVYPDGHPRAGKPVSDEDRMKVATGLLLESFAPFGAAFRRIVQEGGRPSDPTSTILDPKARKRYDKAEGRYVEREGSVGAGLLDWINPFSAGRVLKQSDIEGIEENKRRGEIFDELREESKRKSRRLHERRSDDPFAQNPDYRARTDPLAPRERRPRGEPIPDDPFAPEALQRRPQRRARYADPFARQ